MTEQPYTVATPAEASDLLEALSTPALAVTSATHWPFLLYTTEDGEIYYQGVPADMGNDVDDQNGPLSDLPELEWPLTLLAGSQVG